MKYKNSNLMVVVLYFAIVFFPFMALASGYFAYSEYLIGNNGDMVKLSLGGLLFSFLTPFGFKLFRFVKLEYTLNNKAIVVSNGENRESYIWEKEMTVKDSETLQLFWLYTSDGKTIAMVDYKMPGFYEFRDFINTKINP